MAYPRALLSSLSGLSHRQIRHLAERGLLVPSVRASSGRGSPTLYSREDLTKLCVLGRILALTGGELSRALAAAASEAIDTAETTRGKVLVVDDDGAWLAEDSELPRLIGGLPAALWVSLDDVESRIERDLARPRMAAAA
jgi:hypothetical protein